MRDMIYLSLYYFLKFIATWTPFAVQNAFFSTMAFLFYKFDKKHTKIMRANIKFCFANMSQIQCEKLIRATYRNYAYFAADFLRNQNSTKEKILKKVKFKNENIIQNALDKGSAIIIQTAHYGNWELLNLAMAAKFGAVSTIGRNLDSQAMDKILIKNRSKFDIELIPKKGGAKQILNALKKHRILGILVDQNTALSDGLECEFFGRKILHTPSASIFASKTEALIIPTFIKKIGKNLHEIEFMEPILATKDEIQKATQAQSLATQKAIAQKPDEYFWMHKKFKHFYEEIYK